MVGFNSFVYAELWGSLLWLSSIGEFGRLDLLVWLFN